MAAHVYPAECRGLRRATLQFPTWSMTFPADITAIQDELTLQWHQDVSAGAGSGVEALVIQQHRQNFALWHEEDRARSTLASAEEIAQTKRNIDLLNQVRNDLVEALDQELLQQLESNGINMTGELHSETPGMIIDRLSILSLKIFHTREQTARKDAALEHIQRNRERLDVLLRQRKELSECLIALWNDVQTGRRRFKLYRQLKMYNDPNLNPEIYGGETGAGQK